MDTAWTYSLVAFFFLAAYALVRQSKLKLECESKSGYRAVVCGIGVLFLSAVLRVLGEFGWFSQVPFLSEEVFFDLVYWIGVITGSTILLGGAANWLPNRRERTNSMPPERRHLELIRMAEQLIGVETRLEPLASGLVRLLREELSFQGVVLLRESRSKRRSTPLAIEGDLPISRANLLDIGLSGRSVDIPNDMSRPDLDLAVSVAGRPAARLLVWQRESESLDSETERTVRLIVDILGRQMELRRLQGRAKFAADREALLTQARNECLIHASSQDRFRSAIRSLRKQGSFDLAVLTFWHEGESQGLRFTSAASGQTLIERNHRIPDDRSLIARINRSLVATKYDKFEGLALDEQVPINGQARSLLAYPIRLDQPYRAVLMFVSRSTHAFRPRFELLLKEVSELMPLVLGPEMQSRREAEASHRLELCTGLVRKISTGSTVSESFEVAAVALTDMLDADLLRIAVLDSEGSFLESKALVSSERISDLVPANGQMILSLMPTHCRVIKTGEATIWQEREGGEFPPIERRQLFHQEIGSVMLVPVIHLARVVGVVAAGWLDADRCPPEISPEVKLVAGSLASLMQPTTPLLAPLRERLRTEPDSDYDRIANQILANRSRLEETIPSELSPV